MIRLVHLSDLHIGSKTVNSRLPAPWGLEEADLNALCELAKAASLAAASLTPGHQPEHVQCIVSGDLSARGNDAELSLALTFVRGQVEMTLLLGPKGLAYETHRSHVILGNHDVWGGAHPLKAWINSECRKRKTGRVLWQHYPTPWNVAQNPSAVSYLDSEGLRVRTYLLDSTWTGLRNLLARGRVPQAQLDRLKEIVELDQEIDCQDETIHTVLRIAVVHHPIHPPRTHHLLLLLENAEALRECLQNLGFGMMLCGHEHEPRVHDLGKGLFQCLSGTAAQAASDGVNQFYMYDISMDPGAIDQRRVRVDVHDYTRPAYGPQPFVRSAATKPRYPKCLTIRSMNP